MADYKEMYLMICRATERAIDLLISAQREAEELYLSSADADLSLLQPEAKEKYPPD